MCHSVNPEGTNREQRPLTSKAGCADQLTMPPHIWWPSSLGCARTLFTADLKLKQRPDPEDDCMPHHSSSSGKTNRQVRKELSESLRLYWHYLPKTLSSLTQTLHFAKTTDPELTWLSFELGHGDPQRGRDDSLIHASGCQRNSGKFKITAQTIRLAAWCQVPVHTSQRNMTSCSFG